jgi:branched-chain amino acid transport system substrate-binding protein
MADFAWAKGWRNASLATDTVIVYFKNVVQAFEARWKQLGGKIVADETYQSAPAGGGNAASWQAVTTRLNNEKADVIVTATAPPWGALPTIMNGLRALGNETPFLNSWAGDGTYWVSKDQPTVNYYFVTYASVFGDDPVPAVNKLAKQVKAGTGGFITGPAAIDGVATAIRRAKSTQGLALAAQLEKFRKVPTLSGLVSFTPQLHSVFGRRYRVIRIQDNQAKVVGTVVAKVVPKI